MTDLPSNLELAKGMMELTRVLFRAGSGRADPPRTEGERQLLSCFSSEKAIWKFRLLINLKPLNKHIRYWRFRMESVYSLRNLLVPGSFFLLTQNKRCIPTRYHPPSSSTVVAVCGQIPGGRAPLLVWAAFLVWSPHPRYLRK